MRTLGAVHKVRHPFLDPPVIMSSFGYPKPLMTLLVYEAFMNTQDEQKARSRQD